ncbi:MAG TPA: Type 1 glutamine amidotransferase-like domain-containing protein [Ktedonobacterales bacterium]
MKLLLTSGGVTNTSISNALVNLLGKPIAESSALYIPTALYANPNSALMVARLIRGEFGYPFSQHMDAKDFHPLCGMGWKSLGVLELTALPSVNKDNWVPLLQETDVLLVEGGDAVYLAHWMRQSGLADLLPTLRPETVYVGLSAGSMVMTPNIGEEFVGWLPPSGGDETLGLVDFAIAPHLDYPTFPENSMAELEKWAAKMHVPAYLIDDETAIQVVGGVIEVISEGHWKLIPHTL